MSTIGEAGGPHPCEPAMALVVENDFWIRLVMCDVLAQVGHRVAEASNGFSTLRLAQREPLSLVLLDLVCQSSPASLCWLNSGRLRRRRMFR